MSKILITTIIQSENQLRRSYADENSDDIAYCEDVLGEFPDRAFDAADIISGSRPPRLPVRKAGEAGWREIGYQRAIGRWKSASNRIQASGEFDAVDIIKAESALSAYRAIGQTVPTDLAQFLEIGDVAASAAAFDAEDYATLTEDPDEMATDR